MKVLILDDDADLAASLADALRFENHDVVLATTLGEARAAIEGMTDAWCAST